MKRTPLSGKTIWTTSGQDMTVNCIIQNVLCCSIARMYHAVLKLPIKINKIRNYLPNYGEVHSEKNIVIKF